MFNWSGRSPFGCLSTPLPRSACSSGTIREESACPIARRTISATTPTCSIAEGKDFLFADRREVNLKGFDEPVRLYEVRWQESD